MNLRLQPRGRYARRLNTYGVKLGTAGDTTWMRDLAQPKLSDAQWRERARWIEAYAASYRSHVAPENYVKDPNGWCWFSVGVAADQWESDNRGRT